MDIDIKILNKPFPIYTERAQFDKLVAELGTYDNFKDKFNSMTQEELEKWTLVFSEVKNSTVMSAVSTLFMKNRTKFWTSKKYSLLWHKKNVKQSLTESLNEQKIIKYNANFLYTYLAKKYIEKYGEDDALCSNGWMNVIPEAGKQCITDILWLFPLSPKQMGISPCLDCNVQEFWIAIPDIADNKKMLAQAIKLFGFSLSHEEESAIRTEQFGTPWIILTFEADFQGYVNENIYKNCKYLYHVSPSKYEHRILNQGLVPYSKNNWYLYPPRVYLLFDKIYKNETGQEHVADRNVFIDIAKQLVEARIMTKNQYVNDYEYTVYRIKVKELDGAMKFTYDQNFWPLGIFTANNIPPSVIEVCDRFNVEKETNPSQ